MNILKIITDKIKTITNSWLLQNGVHVVGTQGFLFFSKRLNKS